MPAPGFSLSKSVLDRGAVSKYFASLQSAPEEDEAPAVLSRFDELEVREHHDDNEQGRGDKDIIPATG